MQILNIINRADTQVIQVGTVWFGGRGRDTSFQRMDIAMEKTCFLRLKNVLFKYGDSDLAGTFFIMYPDCPESLSTIGIFGIWVTCLHFISQNDIWKNM